MNRLLSLESLVTAVEAGSISAAAERLGTTKSNVSRRIAELEGHLGARLLNRNPRRLSVTDSGGEFIEQVQRLLGELKQAEERVIDQSAAPRGRLRIACSASFGRLHLKSVVATLMQTHPGLTIDLDLEERAGDLATQGHDCAIRLGPLQDSSLIARKVAPNRHVICASPDYLRGRGVPHAPEDLKEHDGLHSSLREPNSMWQMALGEVSGTYRVNCRMRCNSGEILQEAALAGLGLAILPTFMVARHISNGALQVVLPEWSLPGGSLSVVYVRDRQPSVKLRALIDAMVAAFAPTPSWDLDIAHLVPVRGATGFQASPPLHRFARPISPEKPGHRLGVGGSPTPHSQQMQDSADKSAAA